VKLPEVTGREAIHAFTRHGWAIHSQRGSHVKLVKEGVHYPLIIPVHGSMTIAKGTLESIIKDSGLTIEEFHDYLEKYK
jgi:predicted RNA binding protein YcfA (HicA-like mRNA interferase family)